MNFNRICYGCMQEKISENGICPHCGFDNATYMVPKDHLPPKTPLNGKYLLGKALGQGGFGITYLALDMQLQIPVAIKELFIRKVNARSQSRTVNVSQSSKNAFEIHKARFLKEARILASFNEAENEGIVQVRDFFEEGGTAYMVMEYLQGSTLKDYVTKRGKLTFEETMTVLKPIFHALTKIHEFGVIHKDIGPDNIMVLTNGQAKLLDFGGAYSMFATDVSDIVSFKRGYAPPEQYMANGNIGPWSDIYSLASTIRFCLTGKKPIEAMERKTGKELEPLSSFGVKISKNAEAAINKAMNLDPKERYKKVEDFEQDLLLAKKSPKPFRLIVVAAAAILLVCVGVLFFKPKEPGDGAVSTAKADQGEVQNSEQHEETEEEAVENTEKPAYTVGESMPIDLGTYIFESYANPDCIMGIDSGFGDDGAALIVKDYEDANRNRIIVTNFESDGFYNLQAAHTNSFIQTEESQDLGTPVVQRSELKDVGTQKWYFVYCGHENDKDIVMIENAAGSVLAPQGDTASNGIPVVLAEPDMNNNARKWYVRWSEKDLSEEDVIVYHEGDMVESKSGVWNIASALNGSTMCSVSRYEELDAPEIIVWEEVWDNTQRFEFVLQEESRYRIYPLDQLEGEHKCLQYDPESQKITLQDESDNSNQLFRVIYSGFNMYLIQSYDETVIGFDMHEDGSINGSPVLSRPYEEVDDNRREKWLLLAPQQ